LGLDFHGHHPGRMAAKNALIRPRPFQRDEDLVRMQALLVEGRRAANGSYYLHPGDLSWWLYYLPYEADAWQNIFLWEDGNNPGRLIAWTLISPNWQAFDVFVAPAWHGSRLAEEIYAWSETRLASIIRSNGGHVICTQWIAEHDRWLNPFFARRGYLLSNSTTIQMGQTLDGSIPPAALPPGYQLRAIVGDPEHERRALAQYKAFKSSLPFEKYCQRYLRFMLSPVYQPEHDLVIEAPGGEIAAFCIIWTDETNRVGLFEPVGVHPDFQRKGLGKAIVCEGLRRLQAAEMRAAIVNIEGDNDPAQRLYAATGFRIINRFITYTRQLPVEAD